MFETVHTLTEWYDGPRRGIADYCGQPHLFESEWRDGENLDSDTFSLMPITQETLWLALEDWAIWRRWETAFYEGNTSPESHPALPEDRNRHEDLHRLLKDRLVIDQDRAVRKRASFRRRTDPNWNGLGFAPLEVCWEFASTTLPSDTDRLLFRDWSATDDEEAFHAICSDPDVMQFVGDGDTWSLERTRQWIDQAVETSKSNGYCLWPLILKDASALIGFCGFRPGNDGAEIGWRLSQKFWGRGLATEAARTVLKHGFEKLGFDRVFAYVQSPNRPSIRVCEKLGMTHESTFLRNGREVRVYATRNVHSVVVDPLPTIR